MEEQIGQPDGLVGSEFRAVSSTEPPACHQAFEEEWGKDACMANAKFQSDASEIANPTPTVGRSSNGPCGKHQLSHMIWIPMMKGITIRDVAQVAGVSTATVSNVVNNTGAVSRATKEKVGAAIRSTRWIPNKEARRLACHNRHTARRSSIKRAMDLAGTVPP
jgi:plasmid maintenance system antidote protein VapI